MIKKIFSLLLFFSRKKSQFTWKAAYCLTFFLRLVEEWNEYWDEHPIWDWMWRYFHTTDAIREFLSVWNLFKNEGDLPKENRMLSPVKVHWMAENWSLFNMISKKYDLLSLILHCSASITDNIFVTINSFQMIALSALAVSEGWSIRSNRLSPTVRDWYNILHAFADDE